MIDDSVNYDYIIRYIRSVIPESTGFLKELEEFAAENQVPISQPETIKLIEVLIKFGRCEKVLEVGSAIGYSAIRMIGAGAGKVDTIELNHQAAVFAEKNFARAGFSDRIKLFEGDANDILPELAQNKNNKYDMIFIDAAKAQYNSFFEPCFSMLRHGGLLVSDNVLYKGMTATDDLVLHRKRTIVKRLREYIKMLCEHESLETAVLPLGDGVALRIKR